MLFSPAFGVILRKYVDCSCVFNIFFWNQMSKIKLCNMRHLVGKITVNNCLFLSQNNGETANVRPNGSLRNHHNLKGAGEAALHPQFRDREFHLDILQSHPEIKK